MLQEDCSLKYRPEIDGLRALAVLPVILDHAGVPGLPAGFLGVDVFFVISGFLISSILLDELERGQFSISGFYERRARRLLPPLGLMMFLSIPVAWFVMLPSQLKDFGQSIVASVGFAANIYFWITQDYWAQTAETTPLIHLWSLGVEEQFYLVYPLLLLLVFRRPKALLAALAACLLVSLGGMILVRSNGDAASAFYLLPFRTWELLAGALSAVLVRKKGGSFGAPAWVPWALVASLPCSYAMFAPTSNPLVLNLPPVAATALLLALSTQSSGAGAFLAWPGFVWIGRISYGLYVFHQPVLALARLRLGLELDPAAIVAALLATGLLAMVSYRFVEVPFRDRAAVSVRSVAVCCGVLACLLVAFGLASRSTGGFLEMKLARMSPAGREALQSLRESGSARGVLWDRLLASAAEDFAPGDACRVLVVGDSLSEDLFVVGSLSPCGSPPMEFRRIALDDECIESQAFGRKGVGDVPCAEEMRRFRESSLVRDSECIVIAANWLGRAHALPNLLDLPELQGKAIVLFEPHGFQDMKSLIAYMDREGFAPDSDEFRAYVHATRRNRTEQSNAVLDEIAQGRGLQVISGFDCFCDMERGSCELFAADGLPLIFDRMHLTIPGAQRLGPALCQAVSSAVAKRAARRAIDGR